MSAQGIGQSLDLQRFKAVIFKAHVDGAEHHGFVTSENFCGHTNGGVQG
jgi:hypothetical protein